MEVVIVPLDVDYFDFSLENINSTCKIESFLDISKFITLINLS